MPFNGVVKFYSVISWEWGTISFTMGEDPSIGTHHISLADVR